MKYDDLHSSKWYLTSSPLLIFFKATTLSTRPLSSFNSEEMDRAQDIAINKIP